MPRLGSQLEYDMTVDEVMRRWPSTIRIFLDFRMACIGCPVAAFHTIGEACSEHGSDAAAFLAALRDAVSRCRSD